MIEAICGSLNEIKGMSCEIDGNGIASIWYTNGNTLGPQYYGWIVLYNTTMNYYPFGNASCIIIDLNDPNQDLIHIIFKHIKNNG